ncbi:hypothetical protein P4112_30375 [Pseudomonas aeruginosa]|nr:hypothetical protein [Pseudomonas aeruginosa]
MHPYAKQAFLASPPLVVAYAIAGTIRFDIERDVLGVVDGKEIRLKDLWPSDEEIDAVVRAAVKPEQFRQVYIPMFDITHGEREEGRPALRLAPDEHLHPPPAVLGRRPRRRTHPARHAPAGGAAGQHHHRPPVAVQRDPRRQRGGRVPGENGPARGGLQLLRHPPRRPPHRTTRDLRQPEAVQRDGAQRRRQREWWACWRGSSWKAR